MRFAQAVLVCHAGFATLVLHELPPLLHAASVQPRELLEVTSVVPPTPIVKAEVDG